MQKAMERESGLWVAEKELDEVGQAQCTVCSWSCGNSGRTSNDQDKTDRLAELNTNVQLTTDKYGSVQGKKGLMTITSRSLRWSARVASPGSRNSFLECSVPALGVRLVAPAQARGKRMDDVRPEGCQWAWENVWRKHKQKETNGHILCFSRCTMEIGVTALCTQKL